MLRRTAQITLNYCPAAVDGNRVDERLELADLLEHLARHVRKSDSIPCEHDVSWTRASDYGELINSSTSLFKFQHSDGATR